MSKPLSLAQYLVQQEQHGGASFSNWLSRYTVDHFTGWLHVNRVDEYGFPLPEREADAIYFYPPPEEQEEDNPFQMPVQCEWWLEEAEGVLLGMRQIVDTVMACDGFTWYRIPLPDALSYKQANDNEGTW
ncbi:MAG TPA: hypothetical protein VKT82_33280 [Ktedonobacterales bacterium]|nr:hypothetical protein [Ktedonobacterales bacterium]